MVRFYIKHVLRYSEKLWAAEIKIYLMKFWRCHILVSNTVVWVGRINWCIGPFRFFSSSPGKSAKFLGQNELINFDVFPGFQLLRYTQQCMYFFSSLSYFNFQNTALGVKVLPKILKSMAMKRIEPIFTHLVDNSPNAGRYTNRRKARKFLKGLYCL